MLVEHLIRKELSSHFTFSVTSSAQLSETHLWLNLNLDDPWRSLDILPAAWAQICYCPESHAVCWAQKSEFFQLCLPNHILSRAIKDDQGVPTIFYQLLSPWPMAAWQMSEAPWQLHSSYRLCQACDGGEKGDHPSWKSHGTSPETRNSFTLW